MANGCLDTVANRSDKVQTTLQKFFGVYLWCNVCCELKKQHFGKAIFWGTMF